MDIYKLSLASVNLDDETLVNLFRCIDTKCVLLLDDLDTTRLCRPEPTLYEEIIGGDLSASTLMHTGQSGPMTSEKVSNGSCMSAEGSSRGLIPTANCSNSLNNNDKKSREPQPKLTLSGLLDAIDGVDGPEGRILIMATNFPEELDPALIREGRIDDMVEFTYANREQIRDIFLKTMKPFASKKLQKHDAQKMNFLADSFADKVPEGTLSPARVQRYCRLYVRKPEQAIDDVLSWIEKRGNMHAQIADYARVSSAWRAGRRSQRGVSLQNSVKNDLSPSDW